MGNDGISGIIEINLKDDQPFQHLGIKCFLIGFLGTPFLTQKYTMRKPYQQSSILYQSNCCQQEHSKIALNSNSNSTILRNNTKAIMVNQGKSGTKSGLQLFRINISLTSTRKFILLSLSLKKQRASQILHQSGWKLALKIDFIFSLKFLRIILI